MKSGSLDWVAVDWLAHLVSGAEQRAAVVEGANRRQKRHLNTYSNPTVTQRTPTLIFELNLDGNRIGFTMLKRKSVIGPPSDNLQAIQYRYSTPTIFSGTVTLNLPSYQSAEYFYRALGLLSALG